MSLSYNILLESARRTVGAASIGRRGDQNIRHDCLPVEVQQVAGAEFEKLRLRALHVQILHLKNLPRMLHTA